MLEAPAGGHGTATWASVAWRESAVSWLDEGLNAAGMARTGEVEQPHLRPWATVLKAPTAHGPVWLKAASPTTAFEVRLCALLGRVAPDHVLEPIAVDLERGWVLLPDGGPPLGDSASGSDLAEAITRAVPQYGELQRAVAPHAGELLELGVADMRPEAMPERFEEGLAAIGSRVERLGHAEDRGVVERLRGLRGTFAEWCSELAQAPGPPSLDHNDLHPWNILLGSDGHARFYDWGDAVVAHPFACMLLPLGWLAFQLEIPVDDPAFLRARDGYLEVFSDVAPHAELVATLELACRVAKAARALTWERALRDLPGGEGEHAEAPLGVARRAARGELPRPHLSVELPLESRVEDRFDVDDRRPVQRLEVPHLDPGGANRHDLDAVQPDRIRPVRRAGAEDALLSPGGVPARMDPEHVPARSIQPGQHDDARAGMEIAKALAHGLVEHEPGVGRPLVALFRRRLSVDEGGLDEADRSQLVGHRLLIPATEYWPIGEPGRRIDRRVPTDIEQPSRAVSAVAAPGSCDARGRW